MAILYTPSIPAIKAFDPSLPFHIEFLYGDNQSMKNRVVITNASTDEVVYDRIQIGMKLSHTIPAGTLVSGLSYLARVQVFDVDNNQSDFSEPVLFHCYSAPVFLLTGIENGEVIYNASIRVSLSYSQPDGESLKDFQYLLYDYNKALIAQSDVFYGSVLQDHVFYGLKDKNTYYIRAIGNTAHGMSLDSGYKTCTVQYVTIPTNIVFQTENHRETGTISLWSGIIDYGYEFEYDNYKFEDGTLTLWDNSLTYRQGVNIGGNFTIQAEAKLLRLNKPFLSFNEEIELSIRQIGTSIYCCIEGLGICQYKKLPNAKVIVDGSYLLTDKKGRKIQIVDTYYHSDEFIVFDFYRVNGIYGLSCRYKSDILENEVS